VVGRVGSGAREAREPGKINLRRRTALGSVAANASLWAFRRTYVIDSNSQLRFDERLCCMIMLADVEKYRRYVEHLDLSDEEKAELTRAVWQIVEKFADRAFRLDSVQLVTSGRSSKEAHRDNCARRR
jgi:hypothetical protein